MFSDSFTTLVCNGVGRVCSMASYIFPVVFYKVVQPDCDPGYIIIYFVEANLLQHSMSVRHVWLPV